MPPRSGKNEEVLASQIEDLRRQLDQRFKAQENAVLTALTAAEKTTRIAQETADKAVAKVEAAASKEYLESQIEGLRTNTAAQIGSVKSATDTALVATKDALTAALAASERAISKAEEATEKRFASVNEFRAQLADQTRTFATKTENDFRFASVEKQLEDNSAWQRRIELKFADYIATSVYDRHNIEITEWRRSVDALLTAAASKNSTIYSMMAIGIAVGGLIIALFNLFKLQN